MVAGCQITLASGDPCDVQAIGRCETCGKAHCRTHAAWNDWHQGPYRNYCLPCQTLEATRRADTQQAAQNAMAADGRERLKVAIERLSQVDVTPLLEGRKEP